MCTDSLKYRPLGALVDKLMAEPQFSKAFSRLFAGLKRYTETGEPVEAGTPVKLAANVAEGRRFPGLLHRLYT